MTITKEEIIRMLRNNQLDEVIKIGEPAAPMLIEALKDDNVWVRYEVAEALGKILNPKTVPGLIGALKDRYGDVQKMAARALEKMADKTDIDLLSVRNTLKEFVDRAEGKEEREAASKEAGTHYAKIAGAVQKSKFKMEIGKDGEVVDWKPKPGRGNKDGLFRSATQDGITRSASSGQPQRMRAGTETG